MSIHEPASQEPGWRAAPIIRPHEGVHVVENILVRVLAAQAAPSNGVGALDMLRGGRGVHACSSLVPEDQPGQKTAACTASAAHCQRGGWTQPAMAAMWQGGTHTGDGREKADLSIALCAPGGVPHLKQV
jgi:hypothetical protein